MPSYPDLRLIATLLTLIPMATGACRVNGQTAGVSTSPARQATAANTNEPNRYFKITTDLGSLVIELSNRTPGHRDNFARLVADHYYDGTTFHRIIQGFMIQGGDDLSKDDDPMNDGTGGPSYTIPAEFDSTLLHTFGAVAAARQPDYANPRKASSGSQFYIVQGRPVDSVFLDQRQSLIARYHPGFVYPDSIRTIYLTKGGTPQLDMDYTVFGRVVEGFDVLARIAAVETPRKLGAPQGALWDRPLAPVVMSVVELNDYTPPVQQQAPAAGTEPDHN